MCAELCMAGPWVQGLCHLHEVSLTPQPHLSQQGLRELPSPAQVTRRVSGRARI